MHGLLPVGDTMHISGKCVAKVTGHLSERSFVQNEVVQIPKFDANPNSMIPVRHSQGPPFPGSAIPTVRLTLTITNPNPNP